MRRDDLAGDLRLRNSARASLAPLEAEVDIEAAWREFNKRLSQDPPISTTPDVEPRPLARRLVAVAILLVLIAAAATALVRHEGGSRATTVVPSPAETGLESASTDASPPGDTSNAVPSTTDQSSQAPPELVALLGRTWVITRMDGQPRAFAAYFEMSSGKAVGHDGCNFYDATTLMEGVIGAVSMRVTIGEQTAAGCMPPYDTGWSAPSGRYHVEGDSLTITAEDGSTFEAVDLDSLPAVGSADEIVGEWSVPDGSDIAFVNDGTIRLPCATIGTWTFTDGLHTTLDQTAATAGCADSELRSLSWTFDDLLGGTPSIRRLPDGSLLVGASQLGHLMPPTVTPANRTVSMGELVRPFVDPDICAPLSALGEGDTTGSTFDLHLFAWPTTATSFPIQIIGDPNGGPTAPFALLQRYPDQSDLGPPSSVTAINDWDVSLRVFSNGNGDARWVLPDGGQGYLRSRGLDSEALVAIISSLTARDSSATIRGFDYTPGPTVSPTLQLLVEHLNTGVYGRSAALQCQVAATNFIYWITTLDGDPVFQYALVIDRRVPLDVAYQQGTLVVIEGNEDPTAPTVDDVFNADPTTWNDLLANPAG